MQCVLKMKHPEYRGMFLKKTKTKTKQKQNKKQTKQQHCSDFSDLFKDFLRF